MDILSKSWNAYKFTYMGDECLILPGMVLMNGDQVIVHDSNLAFIASNLPPEQMDDVIYDRAYFPYNKDNINHIELIRAS